MVYGLFYTINEIAGVVYMFLDLLGQLALQPLYNVLYDLELVVTNPFTSLVWEIDVSILGNVFTAWFGIIVNVFLDVLNVEYMPTYQALLYSVGITFFLRVFVGWVIDLVV